MDNPVIALLNGFRVEYEVTFKGDGIFIAQLIPCGMQSGHHYPVQVFLHKTNDAWKSDTCNKELTAIIGQAIDDEAPLDLLNTPLSLPAADPLGKGTPLMLFHADEDEDDLQFFEEAIREIDPLIKLYSMPDGTKLFQLFTQLNPDMVFLGLSVTGKCSLKCIAEIRGNPDYAALPIIVLSSKTRLSSIEAAYRAGADLFMSKPSDYEKLLSSLRAILRLNWKAQLK
ncbi:response regulator [Paraflavisolibacter sp. H34]|uniref:response regulator n=1 Tax=Huijunlia imazamoxiresistens TaxID=3127457 RepID=UPI00301B2976